jgi:hypothetical protein
MGPRRRQCRAPAAEAQIVIAPVPVAGVAILAPGAEHNRLPALGATLAHGSFTAPAASAAIAVAPASSLRAGAKCRLQRFNLQRQPCLLRLGLGSAKDCGIRRGRARQEHPLRIIQYHEIE